jgi:hypothetical protein
MRQIFWMTLAALLVSVAVRVAAQDAAAHRVRRKKRERKPENREYAVRNAGTETSGARTAKRKAGANPGCTTWDTSLGAARGNPQNCFPNADFLAIFRACKLSIHCGLEEYGYVRFHHRKSGKLHL